MGCFKLSYYQTYSNRKVLYSDCVLEPKTAQMWLSVDPMSDKYPSMSPYNYCANNPVILVDPDGEDPDPIVGIGVGLRTNLAGGYAASLSVGISNRTGNFMTSASFTANFYNYGLGTNHGSTGSYTPQADFVFSPALTVGAGTTSLPMPFKTFNNNSATGLSNNFNGSFSIGTNFVYNTEGKNQRVGYAGFKLGGFGFNFYNDVIPLLGDKNDRFWSGGGSVQMMTANFYYMMGTDTFTGERQGKDLFGNWLSMSGNPANGLFGTYAQTGFNQLLNNGQSISLFSGVYGASMSLIAGKGHLYSQNLIHNYLSKNKLFYSTASGE